MIKANEIRIGNWIADRGLKEWQIDHWDSINKVASKAHTTMCMGVMTEMHPLTEYVDYLKPIELTENWLIKFGFEKALNEWWCPDEVISYEGGFVGFGTDRFTMIKYVHELQNYYFAVTGNELSVSV